MIIRLLVNQLNQIPQVAVQVLENRDCAVGGIFRFPDEFNSQGEHMIVITPKIISLQKQEHASASLAADIFLLFTGRGPGEQ